MIQLHNAGGTGGRGFVGMYLGCGNGEPHMDKFQNDSELPDITDNLSENSPIYPATSTPLTV
jgi:hypothetical protein